MAIASVLHFLHAFFQFFVSRKWGGGVDRNTKGQSLYEFGFHFEQTNLILVGHRIVLPPLEKKNGICTRRNHSNGAPQSGHARVGSINWLMFRIQDQGP